MRFHLKRDVTTPVDGQIKAVLKEMDEVGVTGEKYPELIKQLTALYEIRKTEVQSSFFSMDTIASVGGNLFGLGMLFLFEQRHVITSRAFSQVNRLRTPT